MLKKEETTTESYEPGGVKRLYFYFTSIGSEGLDTHQLSSVILARIFTGFPQIIKVRSEPFSYEKKNYERILVHTSP